MHIHVFQHVPFEGVGSMESWFDSREAKVTYNRFYDSCELPDISCVDLLVVMGGPMNVDDELSHPWLVEEKILLRKIISAGIPVLGVCLGAQMIASALGSRIFANQHKEIGWFPVESVTGHSELLPFPKRFPAFHWHGDTFDLPKGAMQLVRNEVCENQAFIIGENVIGLQFHLETTPEAVELMIKNCPEDMVDGPYVQCPKTIRELTVEYADLANVILNDTLDFLIS